MIRSLKDQMGSDVVYEYPPSRIISLVPSHSELLADFGLDECVVGITKFCVHPESWFTTKPFVGGTKKFDFDAIERLRPDLIIGNKEENYKEGIEQLRTVYPVWMSDITSWDEAIEMIHSLGDVTGRTAAAHNIIQSIEESFTIHQFPKTACSVLYLIWRGPWMAAAGHTFVDTMISKIGLHNCLGQVARYPQLSDEDLRQLNPDIVFLSSEPFPFQAKHVNEVQSILPSSRVVLVDGEMFSWYGSRLSKAAHYFQELLHSLQLT